jgi:predicted deacylase
MNIALPEPVIEVLPKDLSPYREGNTGVDYVHTFDSGKPGPHVVVNALTHGNELCGMTAVTWLLDNEVRPLRGRLTLSFANVAAYETFDPGDPFASRQVDRDMNRVWGDGILNGEADSHEVRRAREMLPVFAAADALLDVHSTSNPVHPMLCYTWLPKVRALAGHIAYPTHHIVSSGLLHQGPLLFEYGRFRDANEDATAILVECGQHFARKSGDIALATALRFLDYYGLADPQLVESHGQIPAGAPAPQHYEVSEVLTAATDDFRFVRPLLGFEEFAEGELIATDGSAEYRAPYARCAVIMPRREPKKGGEVATIARRL